MAYGDSSNPQFSDPLLQRFFMSPAEKENIENGKKIVKAFHQEQTSNDSTLNFFKLRNARQIELLLWCKGSQKMSEFLDFMNVSDANKSYVNVDTTPTRIAAQFMGTLVESMSKNKTYPCVSAIDNNSLEEKEQRLFDALWRMHEAQTVTDLHQQAGMQLEPANAYVPDDEIAAKVYFELEDRLPKEIQFEKLLQKLQNDIKFERIINRKTIFDLTVLNAGFTKIERQAPGQYTVRKCIPTNMVYNFFMNDTGEYEITKIGEFWNIKVRNFRTMFGKTDARPNGLTEKEIFKLAQLSTNKNIGTFNYMWNDNWALTTYNQNRPYDDCSILVLDCEIDCGEDVYYVEKTDAYGKGNISPRKNIPYQQTTKDGKTIDQPKPDNVEIVKRQKNTWMRGVYAPYGDKMLYWGRPDLIITPYTNTSKPLCSYTVNIPFNDGEYVPSLFERGMEVLREYQLTKLKRKQLIAKIKPSGIRIDVESARNLDLGTGDSIAWEEVVRIYDQTGNELWSSKGVDPLQREAPPLSNTVRDESIEKVVGLSNVLAGLVVELRQLWGVPMFRDGSDVGDRTAAKLAEGQNESSYNVTDFIVNANNQLWEETFYKVCLLHWNDIVKGEPEDKADMLNTRFDLKIKTKSTDYEKQRLEQDIQRYSQVPDAMGNPSLTLKDAIMLREIDDYKLACWYLSATYEKNRKAADKQKADIVAQTSQQQQASNAQTGQNEMALEEQKHKWKMEEIQAQQQGDDRAGLTTGLLNILAKTGGEVPDTLKPLFSQVMQNISIGMVLDNAHTKQAIQEASQEAMAQSQQGQQQESPQGQPDQSQMQPQ
jgi:predicted amino acid-binding ACT domain protein